MLDTIYYRSEREVVLIFTDRSPFTLYSSSGRVIELLDEFLAPINTECATLTEWNQRLKAAEGDTQIIDLDKVA